jgi:hypothetical protein
MKYRAFKIKLNNGLETFGLLPLSKECNIVDGRYFVETNTLLLVSEKDTEKFDLVERFKSSGEYEEAKNKMGNTVTAVERLRVQTPYNYQLVGDDVEWFVKEYVSNSDFALEIINLNKLKIEKPQLITTEN